MTLDRLRGALAARTPRDLDLAALPADRLPPAGLSPAAVLVPLLEKDGEAQVLLTRRRRDLRHHPGQVSFPGGRLDPGEAPLAGALREAREEIGLAPSAAEVLGRLDETLVLTSPFRLTPFVARVPYPGPYVGHPGEVEAILLLPLATLLRPEVHRTEVRDAYGMSHEVHVFDAGGDRVWGATARVLWQLLGAWRSA